MAFPVLERIEKSIDSQFQQCFIQIQLLLFNLRYLQQKLQMVWKAAYIVVSIILSEVGGYQLGNNLIENSKFSQPIVSVNYQYFSQSIPGWQCSNYCQLDNCQTKQIFVLLFKDHPPLLTFIKYFQKRKCNCFIRLSFNCSHQALDLASESIDAVSQSIQMQAGRHLFSIQFLLPFWQADSKILLVLFNGAELYRFYPNVSSDNLVYHFSTYVYALEGSNNLTLTMNTANDSIGFKIISVSLARIISLEKQFLISVVTSNNIIEGLFSFPAFRVLLGEIANFFISFDRLQLYYYHNRRFSYYTNIFLSQISNLLDFKGGLSLSLQEKLFGNVIQKGKDVLNSLDFKYQYINAQVLDRSSNGYGFISNNSNLVVYSIPFIVAFALLLNGLFRLCSEWRLSRKLRKYSYFGPIVLLMVCEGNIEQYSFYVFGEFSTFFSTNFTHKMVNVAIALFFLVVVFSSFGLYLWLWGQYKNKIWCIVEDTRLSLSGMIGFSINRGAVCLLFGAVHQLLQSFPSIQLLSLGVCQILWIVAQMIGLARQIYQSGLLVWLNIIEGFLRRSFQFTLYIYTIAVDNGDALQSDFINEQIHLYQIYLFLIVWALEFFACLLFLLSESLFSESSKIPQKKQRNRKNRLHYSKSHKKIINFYLVLKKGRIKKFYSRPQNS